MSYKDKFIRRVVFTSFETEIDYKDFFINTRLVRCGGYGLEKCPKTGEMHYQGWLCLNKQMRWKSVKERLFVNNEHFEPMGGKLEDNIKYCSKDELYEEWGDIPKAGKRNDLINIRELVKNGASYKDLIENDETCGSSIRYERNIKNMIKMYRNDDNIKNIKCIKYNELYTWQKKIVDMVQMPPDNRKVNWLWDADGNSGKSELIKYLIKNHEAIEVSGKCADIKYAICNMEVKPKIICMDLSRSNEEYVNYDIIEQLKNGKFFSTKYESEMVLFDIPHIIITSNFEPEYSKLSYDRWNCVSVRGEG